MPFDWTLRLALADAGEHTTAGLVDLSWKLNRKGEGKSAVEVLPGLREAISAADGDLFVSYGDCCLLNVLVAEGGRARFGYSGRAGIVDQRSDLAGLYGPGGLFGAALMIDIGAELGGQPRSRAAYVPRTAVNSRVEPGLAGYRPHLSSRGDARWLTIGKRL